MKKSINLWALSYPAEMMIAECFQLCKDAGFDGAAVNFAPDGVLRPDSTDSQIEAVGQAARRISITISGAYSFLFWPYSLTHIERKTRWTRPRPT